MTNSKTVVEEILDLIEPKRVGVRTNSKKRS